MVVGMAAGCGSMSTAVSLVPKGSQRVTCPPVSTVAHGRRCCWAMATIITDQHELIVPSAAKRQPSASQAPTNPRTDGNDGTRWPSITNNSRLEANSAQQWAQHVTAPPFSSTDGISHKLCRPVQPRPDTRFPPRTLFRSSAIISCKSNVCLTASGSPSAQSITAHVTMNEQVTPKAVSVSRQRG